LIQWARNPVGSNRFFYDFVGWIRSAYLPLCEGKIKFRGGAGFFWVIFGGIGQKPCAESDFAHAPGGALAFVWLARKGNQVHG